MPIDNSYTEENRKRLNFNPEEVERAVRQATAAHEEAWPGITDVALSMVRMESSGGRNNVGPALSGKYEGDRAVGPFQYTKGTADDRGIDRFDLYQNVEQGVRDLVGRLDKTGGRFDLAVSMHQAGGGHAAYREGLIPDVTDGYTHNWEYTKKILEDANKRSQVDLSRFIPDKSKVKWKGDAETSIPDNIAVVQAGTDSEAPPAPTVLTGELVPQADTGALPGMSVDPASISVMTKSQLNQLFSLGGDSGSGGSVNLPDTSTLNAPSASQVLDMLGGPAKRNSQLWGAIRQLF